MKLFSLYIFVILTLVGCSPNGPETKHHSLKFSKQVDSLLSDTTSAGSIIDSLKKELEFSKFDTAAIDLLNELAFNWKGKPIKMLSEEALRLSRKIKYEYGKVDAISKQGYYLYWNYLDDSAIVVYQKALDLARIIKNQKLEAQILFYIGDIYRVHNNYLLSRKYYGSSLKIAQEIRDERRMAVIYSVLADIKRTEGEYDSSLFYYRTSHKLALKLDDIKRQAFCEAYIGDIYRLQGKQVDALNQFRGAIILALKTKDQNILALSYSSCGTLYRDLSEPDSAFSNFKKALKISQQSNDYINIIANLNEIGNYYYYGGHPETAIKYFREELVLAMKINEKISVVHALNSIGDYHREITGNLDSSKLLYDKAFILAKESNYRNGLIRIFTARTYDAYNKKDYAAAIIYGKQVLNLCIEINEFKQQIEAYRILTKAYADNKNYKEAYFLKVIREKLQDSLRGQEEIKKFASTEYKFVERNLVLQHKQKEKINKLQQAKKDEEIKRQQFVRNAFILGFGIIALFSILLYRSLRQNKKQKIVIQHQMEIVEEKQKEVMDSIRYAQRIQKALLPSQKYLEKVFKKLRE